MSTKKGSLLKTAFKNYHNCVLSGDSTIVKYNPLQYYKIKSNDYDTYHKSNYSKYIVNGLNTNWLTC